MAAIVSNVCTTQEINSNRAKLYAEVCLAAALAGHYSIAPALAGILAKYTSEQLGINLNPKDPITRNFMSKPVPGDTSDQQKRFTDLVKDKLGTQYDDLTRQVAIVSVIQLAPGSFIPLHSHLCDCAYARANTGDVNDDTPLNDRVYYVKAHPDDSGYESPIHIKDVGLKPGDFGISPNSSERDVLAHSPINNSGRVAMSIHAYPLEAPNRYHGEISDRLATPEEISAYSSRIDQAEKILRERNRNNNLSLKR